MYNYQVRHTWYSMGRKSISSFHPGRVLHIASNRSDLDTSPVALINETCCTANYNLVSLLLDTSNANTSQTLDNLCLLLITSVSYNCTFLIIIM